MLNVDGIKQIKKIPWNEIEPGMVLLGGLKINGRVPEFLEGFPVLTPGILNELTERYRLLGHREVLVAKCLPGVNARQLSMQLRQGQRQLQKINIFRREFFRLKQDLLEPGAARQPLFQSPALDTTAARWGNYNSFQFPALKYGAAFPLPSFFHRPGLDISLGDLLTNKVNAKFYLPEDKEILLHFVIDSSKAALSGGRLQEVVRGLNFLNRYLPLFLLKTRIRCYAFSATCRPLQFPLSGGELKREDACYATFIKKVLHHKNKEVRNFVVLFASSPPADSEEAFRLGRLFIKNKLDYTQILLAPEPESLQSYTALAAECGGNQLVLKEPCLSGVLGGEVYDHYLGLLALTTARGFSPPPGFLQKAQPDISPAGSSRGDISAPAEKITFPGGKVKKVVKWTDWYKQKNGS